MQKPGHTRNCLPHDHLRQTSNTFIRTPLPGLTRGMAIVHAAPTLGTGFAMMTVEFEPGGVLTKSTAQRLIYVIEGELQMHGSDSRHPVLRAGYFAYLSARDSHSLIARDKTRAIVIEKTCKLRGSSQNMYQETPHSLVGDEAATTAGMLNEDEGVEVRALLPSSLGFNFALSTMTYEPGASLPQVEVHHMELGLLVLEGGGIYRLGDAWYHASAGDFIWIAPFCPLWFGCVGKVPAKYLIYQDFNG